LGAIIEILEKEKFDHSLKIRVNNKEITISDVIANTIFVQ